jgi:hypothetical protein
VIGSYLADIKRHNLAFEGPVSIVLRPGTPMDAAVCGPICFEAFKAIDNEHNFPWDFPSAEVATGLLTMMLSNPDHGSSGGAEPDDWAPADGRRA